MRHLDDAQLARYMDGEHATAEEGARWREHVGSCDRCRRETELMAEQSRVFSAWLARADFEADLDDPGAAVVGIHSRGVTQQQQDRRAHSTAGAGRPGTSAWLKAAVIVLLVAAPLAAFPPMRAWIAATMGPETTTPQTSAVASDDGPVVRFTPEPGVFVVRFDGVVAGATLRLERAEGDDAVLRVVETAEPVVAAGSLRIRGSAEDAAYRLELPGSVTAVDIYASGRVTSVPREDLDAGRTVGLDDF